MSGYYRVREGWEGKGSGGAGAGKGGHEARISGFVVRSFRVHSNTGERRQKQTLEQDEFPPFRSQLWLGITCDGDG